MNVAVLHTPEWTISTRPRGEVLTASVASGGVDLSVFSVPDGYSRSEFEGWLRDLIGVAHETARGDAQPRPIPALLHHVLTGLLFSHAELWEPAGIAAPCSVAFASGEDEVGFGWVGEAAVQMWLNDLPLDAGWVRVRDDSGREAHAISLDARSRVRIRLEWSPQVDGERGVTLEAQWPFGETAAGPVSEPPEAEAEVADVPPPAPQAAARAVASSPVTAAPETVPAVRDESVEPTAAEPPAAEPEVDAVYSRAPEPPAETVSPPRAGGRKAGRLASAMGRISSWWTRRPRAANAEPPTAAGEAAAPYPVATPPAPATIESWDPHLRVLGVPEMRGPGGPPVLRVPGAPPSAGPAIAPPAAPRTSSAAPMPAADVDSPPLPGLSPSPIQASTVPGAHDTLVHPPLDPPAPTPARDDAASGRTVAAGPALVEPTPRAIEDWIARELAEQGTPPAPAAPSPAPAEDSLVSPATQSIPPAAPGPEAVELPARPAPVAEPEGALPARTPLRPQWPTSSELDAPPPLWKRPWVWVVVMIALFAGGWLVGGRSPARDDAAGPHGLARVLRAVGLGGAHFDVTTNSRPEGAWIAVDGKDLTRRTPASLDLPAGRHVVTLSISDLGSVSYTVTGERGQQLAIDAPMWGSLIVRESDSGLPVTVELDGRALGYVPVMLDSVLPGPHELRFSGPGMVPWGQTVEVRVRQQAEVLAHPMTSPATGVIEVRATLVDDQGEQPLNGGEVYIDGELRGRTPLTLDLPRGPHSARVVYHGESAPVQVIDLPGGNQRFANFELGAGADRPTLVASGVPDRIVPDQTTVASASLNGVAYTDVKEMWLHVRTPEGPWRRYQMEILKTTFGAVGVAVYPTTLFDDQGTSRYYTSALTASGDEYFTEIATVRLQVPKRGDDR